RPGTTMKILRGIPVSAGVAIGTAVVMDTEGQRIPPRHIEAPQVESEIERVRDAFALAARETRESQHAISAKLGRHFAEIFNAHAMLLEGQTFPSQCEAMIRDQLYAGEFAVSQVIGGWAQMLASSLGKDSRFGSRSMDLLDIERRVLRHLMGQRREQL